MKNIISSEPSVPFSGNDRFGPLEQAVRFHVSGVHRRDRGRRAGAGAGGRERYQRAGEVKGYRNCHRDHHLILTFGLVTVSLPRARLIEAEGREREWRSASVEAYKRLTKRAETVIAGAYLAGGLSN